MTGKKIKKLTLHIYVLPIVLFMYYYVYMCIWITKTISNITFKFIAGLNIVE